MLRKVEQALQAAIEKPFGRLFPQKLQPAEVKARLRAAMEDATAEAVCGRCAANYYLVRMNPEDYREIEAVGAELEVELARYLLEAAADAGLLIGPYAAVSVTVAESVPAGEVAVEAKFGERPPANLQAEAGLPQPGRRVALKERSVIGRSNDCDIVIGEQAVSRRHCEIIWDCVQYLVRDLQSANGTFLNGEQVAAAGLRDGDLLEVGFVQLRFGDGEA